MFRGMSGFLMFWLIVVVVLGVVALAAGNGARLLVTKGLVAGDSPVPTLILAGLAIVAAAANLRAYRRTVDRSNGNESAITAFFLFWPAAAAQLLIAAVLTLLTLLFECDQTRLFSLGTAAFSASLVPGVFVAYIAAHNLYEMRNPHEYGSIVDACPKCGWHAEGLAMQSHCPQCQATLERAMLRWQFNWRNPGTWRKPWELNFRET